MNNYIKKSHNKVMTERKEFTLFGTISVFVKDPLPQDVKLTDVIMDLEDTIPPHFLYQVETILIGQFKELQDREIRGAYLDGGIYVTNEQPSEDQLFEDIVHEIAHSVEKMFEYELYADGSVEKEYIGKKVRFLDLLAANGVSVPSRLRYETEYSKMFDEFLFFQIGYEKVAPFTEGLFLTPYASVSVSEYFATAFEYYFVEANPEYVKKICPALFNKIKQFTETGESDEI